MPRLEILQNSLKKKEEKFDQKISEHFADVKSANGQPLNDKRNGQATRNRWDKQDAALRNLKEGIEVTKEAIRKEENKVAGVEAALYYLPDIIKEKIQSGEITQWRRFPDYFFVKGVNRARFKYFRETNSIAWSYFNEVTDPEQRKSFVKVFKEVYHALDSMKKPKEMYGIFYRKSYKDQWKPYEAGKVYVKSSAKRLALDLSFYSHRHAKNEDFTYMVAEGSLSKPLDCMKRLVRIRQDKEGTTIAQVGDISYE